MNKIMKISLLATILYPLIVDNSVFFPFVSGKSLFIRGLLVVVSVLFTILFFYKKSFKNEIIIKINKLIKQPIIISILAFIFITIISTIFAVDKYTAFWGELERAEGLVGILFFFSFFMFSLLIFEKKDWILFFKLSLVSASVLIFKEFLQFFVFGIKQPGSFIGNPAFLAGYLIFSIFCSIIILSEKKPSKTIVSKSKYLFFGIFKYLSMITLVLSIVAIFITERRAAIIGVVVGVISILIYSIFKGKNIFYKKINLQKFSIVLLCLLFIFSFIFISTRKNEIWQNIPGISRIAIIGTDDNTTSTRLIVAKLSLDSVNPIQNGWKKLLIGWGPENYIQAYSKFINPELYAIETTWFDRSHNKILDVLVMNGVLGLMSFFAIYFYFFKFIFKRKEFSLLNVGLLFGSVSVLINLMFIFDQMTTYLALLSILSFGVYSIINIDTKKEDTIKNLKVNNVKNIYAGVFFVILTTFLGFVFIRNDLTGYLQAKRFSSIIRNDNSEIILNNINSVFYPITTAQESIRKNLLIIVDKDFGLEDKNMIKLTNIATKEADIYSKKVPFNATFLSYLANIFTNKGTDYKNSNLLFKGEEYFRKMIILAPSRPNFNYDFALNLFNQQKYNESFKYFEKYFDFSPSFFSNEIKKNEGIYIVFLQHFYFNKDKENFSKTIERLKGNNYVDSATLSNIYDYIDKNNIWPKINFK